MIRWRHSEVSLAVGNSNWIRDKIDRQTTDWTNPGRALVGLAILTGIERLRLTRAH